MIIWLDGPFGVGKSSTVRHLVAVLDGAAVVDPERHGWLLLRTWGRLRPGDYQSMPAWRLLVARSVRRAASRHEHVLVPMSLPRPQVRDELFARIRRPVRHVLLSATPATLRDRIEQDQADPDARSWRLQHADPAAWPAPGPDTVTVPTDGLTPPEVAAAVLAALG